MTDRVDLDMIDELCRRRRDAKMTGVWLHIEDVESMVAELRAARDLVSASTEPRQPKPTTRKPTGAEVMAQLANWKPRNDP